MTSGAVDPFFSELTRRSEKACNPQYDRCIRIGPYRILLCFSSAPLLEALFPALSHLHCEPAAQVDLTIRAWDSRFSGVTMVSPAWGESEYGKHGLIHGFNDERYFTIFQFGMDVLHSLDLESRQASFWIRDPGKLEWWEKASPFRILLNFWLGQMGLSLLHAAAVANDSGGLLLIGRGGSGKSTTALVCLQNGFSHLGDDSVLIGNTQKPRVYSIYSTAKLNDQSLALLPSLNGLLRGRRLDGGTKQVVFLREMEESRLAKEALIRAIVLPSIDPSRSTSVTRLSSAQALLALAPTSIMQIPGTPGNRLLEVSKLVQHLPCFSLSLRPDPGAVVRGVNGVIQEAQTAWVQ